MAEAEASQRKEEAEPDRCALCGRVLGRRVEWHHLVPKSRGGRRTVALHPICHRTIHAHCRNSELAALNGDLAALRAQPDIARFLDWIAGKPPDFHAPTRSRR
ncbi:HNH endonuclease [Stakelama saccharophila]|uniref:HNH endonuclease n=1 Tax=Stakelama saccharophila TaxID=3075605 RepID=A0ABZ0BCM0_9SPHN|nr:HNH endonuclease [Stakelama sp. W311]WNO55093.1 HNH endonuclease [Stakelama sp. W311]